MKIRTVEELQELIDEDWAWRLKELNFLKKNIKKNIKHPEIKTHLRSCIVLLYAHWEGFIKNAAENYLTYVALKGFKYNELIHCFIALGLKSKLLQCETTNSSSIHTQVVEFLLEKLSQRAEIPYQNIIKTESNLNSKRLKDILITIGLDYTPYETNSNFIDSILLHNRNTIAHGQKIRIEEKEFKILFQKIIDMLRGIKNEIINAAFCESYKTKKAVNL